MPSAGTGMRGAPAGNAGTLGDGEPAACTEVICTRRIRAVAGVETVGNELSLSWRSRSSCAQWHR